MQDPKELSEEAKNLKRTFGALSRQIREEMREIRVMWDFFHQDPVPAWIKHPAFMDGKLVGFVMIAVNRAYETRFGAAPEMYKGERDLFYWPEPIAERYWKNDKEVHDSLRPKVFTEQAPLRDGTVSDLLVYKAPIRHGELTCVAGRDISDWRGL